MNRPADFVDACRALGHFVWHRHRESHGEYVVSGSDIPELHTLAENARRAIDTSGPVPSLGDSDSSLGRCYDLVHRLASLSTKKWDYSNRSVELPDDPAEIVWLLESVADDAETDPRARRMRLSEIPPLDTKSGEWCSREELVNVTGKKLGSIKNQAYRSKEKSADVGVDVKGRAWRKEAKNAPVVWYLKETLLPDERSGFNSR